MSIDLLDFGTNPAANAAAVDGPPIAAFDAVKISSQLERGQIRPATFKLIKEPRSKIAQWTINATVAKINAVGPPQIADDTSAVAPTAANRKKKETLQSAGPTTEI